MTDRVHSLTVILGEDMRTDEVVALQDAIGQFRGVISVAGNVSDVAAKVAQERARHMLREQILAVLWPRKRPES